MRRALALLVLLAAPAWGSGASVDSSALNGEQLTIAHHADLTPGSGDFSISMWIKATPQSGAPHWVLEKDDVTSANGYNILVWNGEDPNAGKVRFNIRGASGNSINSDAAIAGAWHHLAVHRASNTMRMWVDGTLQAATASASQNIANTDDLVLLNYSTTGNWEIDANIAHVEFWKSKALSAAEVAQVMRCPGSVPGSLKMHLPLRGLETIDLSGNGRAASCSTCPSASSDGPPVMQCGGGPQ